MKSPPPPVRRPGPAPRPGSPPPPDVRPVLDGVRRIVQSLRLSAERARRDAGVSGAQLFVLEKLAEADAQSVNDLAARTATDQSSVSAVVARLARARLVERRPDPRDRRCVHLALTAKGRALLGRSPGSGPRDLVHAIASLPPADRRRLSGLLGRVVARIGDAPPALFFESDAAAKPRSGRATRTPRRRGTNAGLNRRA